MHCTFVRQLAFAFLSCAFVCNAEPTLLSPPGGPLEGSAPLTMSGDLASNLVAGVDRFLDHKLAESVRRRSRPWESDPLDTAVPQTSDETELRRRHLAVMLGVVEERVRFDAPEWIASLTRPSLVATSELVRIHVIRWPAFGEVHGEGLLLQPVHSPVANIIALPDADTTPESLAGLDNAPPHGSPFARRLAESGCRVVVPFLINRNKGEPKVGWDEKRGRQLSNREYLHRAAFEMGRTLTGYELLKILSIVDWFQRDNPTRPVGVVGWGEGGRLALYAAALDTRFALAGVSGYFGPREKMWTEPLDRNVFGLLDRFGDAELVDLVAPRPVIIEAARSPELEFASDGGAPAGLATPPLGEVRAELGRSQSGSARLIESGNGTGPFGTDAWLQAVVGVLPSKPELTANPPTLQRLEPSVGGRERADRQRRELDRHTQELLVGSPYVRQEFLSRLDTTNPAKFAESQARYRSYFDEKIIGRFDDEFLPPNPRSRLAYDDPRWKGYEVVLDVYPDVFAYGLLLLPKDLRPGERRPVVVCQHGLEGRPQDTIGTNGFNYYSAFSARLAEEGFITFAPQNLYIFRDRFRVLQRKANPLGKTLFSIITPQHKQIVSWLKSQPFVDPDRIAFYGLSYGGKTAMRVPASLTDYCLSICSADFNEWVWKNTSTRSPYSYVWTGEYEIFEWNLGQTFNYAEMATLIAPRPFMVERGHFDGVAPDETVGYEFAKVRHFYAARLRLPPESCVIEWFVGPHQIHGVGTFEFLRRHLAWQRR